MSSTPQVSDERNLPLDNGIAAAAPVPAATDDQPPPPVEVGPRLRRLGIHGPRQSGKTCYLTVLHRFRKTSDAAMVLKDDATISYLQGLWDRYLVQGRHTPRTAGLPAEIRFDLQAGGRTWEIQSRDYPGERVQRPVDAETLAWLESCDAVLVFVDASSPPDLLAERLNEVDLLISALRQLSHDGNTIARPLGLVLTKWDTQGPVAAGAPEGEEQRAQAWLCERPEFRQLFHALQHAGHPDRVKVFPVSAFGENRGGTDPPEGGPRTPLKLHAPLVWAMRLGDERLLETARRRAGERLDRWWPNYRGALAEYEDLVARGINKGPLFDEEIEPERRLLRQRLTKRRWKTAAILIPLLLVLTFVVLALFDLPEYDRALAALDDHEKQPAEVTEVARVYLDRSNPMGRLLGRKKDIEERLKSSLLTREEYEYEALRAFLKRHPGDDQARQRAEQLRTFRERWPSSEHQAEVLGEERSSLAAADAQRRRNEQRADYEALLERVKTLTAEERHDSVLKEYQRFLDDWRSGNRI